MKSAQVLHLSLYDLSPATDSQSTRWTCWVSAQRVSLGLFRKHQWDLYPHVREAVRTPFRHWRLVMGVTCHHSFLGTPLLFMFSWKPHTHRSCICPSLSCNCLEVPMLPVPDHCSQMWKSDPSPFWHQWSSLGLCSWGGSGLAGETKLVLVSSWKTEQGSK